MKPFCIIFSRDVDSVWSYTDSDPPNLMNSDPGEKITKFFEKSKIILNFKSELKPYRLKM